MFKYFSYYSVGGYKDFYLGNSNLSHNYLYYLPLLAVQEKKAMDAKDETQLAFVNKAKTLPKMNLITNNNDYGFPSQAIPLVSHGGYDIIFSHMRGQEYALILRDIDSNSADESGRKIPFLFMIVSDTEEDSYKLAGISCYWANYKKSVSVKIASLLGYDNEYNGLRFALSEFNNWIQTISAAPNIIELVNGKRKICPRQGDVALLVAHSSITKEFINKELQLGKMNVNLVFSSKVLPLDNKAKIEEIKKKSVSVNASRRNRILWYAVSGIIIGTLVYTCFHVFNK